MEIVSGLLSCALAPLCSSLYNQCNNIRKFKEHKEIFKKEVEQLKSQGSDIRDEVNRGKQRHGKNPKREVTLWLENWQKLVHRIESTEIENENGTCLRGGCPNCYLRWKRGKRIEKLMNEVRDLQAKRQFSDGLFADSLPEVPFPATTLHGGSAGRKKDEILNCIMDPGVSKIGVFGMGGVGKTTIMTQIYNQLKESGGFDSVIWVTVSSSFNLEKLQDKIADELGCELSSSTDETRRARLLYEAFMRMKNFVIILDDVWDEVSLRNVGIPEADDISNGSKIVWTTRSIKVCNNMESQREIKVEGLTGEEAWSLFKDKVGGEDVLLSPAIEEIARQVADECAGLPLALITVGRAMRNTAQLEVWRNALQELKSSSTQQIDGMDKKVFGSLIFSYNRLSNHKVRSCFLYCALYPEDCEIHVNRLIKYWMAEGLIDEVGSIKREKDKGHAILKELKDACMIESLEDDKFVKLHDLIRDLAINITMEREQPLITSEMEQPPLFMVKAGLGLEESPKEEEWVEGLERVSLMSNYIKTFEGQPNCPQLSTLLLQWSNLRDSISLSDTFFKNMHKLRVLDLSCTGIESLPDSLSDLVNLHALILNYCHKLKCLPSLAKLHKLRQLKLKRLSSLQELPHGLENLVKLRHLAISNGGWESCPSGALSKMICLEALFMEGDKWSLSYGNNGNGQGNSTFGEIIGLKNLTRFSVEFTDILTFNSYITKADRWKCLDYFLFGIRCIESLKYDGHGEIKEKIKLPYTVNHLAVGFCDVIQLSDIFCCHKKTFKNLSQMFIFHCEKLKYLMPLDLLENNLENLEEMVIQGCSEMEAVFASEASAAGTITLPKLKRLILKDLPALTSICQEKLVCDSLCEMFVHDCPNIKKLPFLMNNVPLVPVRIEVDKEWWEALEWDDQQLKEQLHLFFQHATVMPWYGREGFSGSCIKIEKVDAKELNAWK